MKKRKIKTPIDNEDPSLQMYEEPYEFEILRTPPGRSRKRKNKKTPKKKKRPSSPLDIEYIDDEDFDVEYDVSDHIETLDIDENIGMEVPHHEEIGKESQM